MSAARRPVSIEGIANQYTIFNSTRRSSGEKSGESAFPRLDGIIPRAGRLGKPLTAAGVSCCFLAGVVRDVILKG